MTPTVTSTVPTGAVHAPDAVLDWGASLVAGRVVRDAAAEELTHDPALEAAYLGRVEAAQ